MSSATVLGPSRRELEEHRERIGRLICSSFDHGFGNKAWWVGTFLDDEDPYPEIQDMFGQPSEPTTAAAPSAATSPSAATPSSPSESITASVFELASYINQMPKEKKTGLPSRNKLRKDDYLKGEVSRKTGILRIQKRGSKLRWFEGDERLFDQKLWAWLCNNQTEEANDDEQVARDMTRKEWGLRARSCK